jgi:serine/threonine protein kinase
MVGTVSYMSPEQAEGGPLDGRFSFGSVLYEMATGLEAFRGGSAISRLGAIVRERHYGPGTARRQVLVLYEATRRDQPLEDACRRRS